MIMVSPLPGKYELDSSPLLTPFAHTPCTVMVPWTEESRREYRETHRKVKVEVAVAKQRAYGHLYARLDSKEGDTDLHGLARQRCQGRAGSEGDQG